MNYLCWSGKLLRWTHYDGQGLTMIKFPSKGNRRIVNIFIFLQFPNHEQKYLLGKIRIIVALTLSACTLLLNSLVTSWSGRKLCNKVDLISTETKSNKSLSSLASEQNAEWLGVVWPSLKCCNGPDSYSCPHKTNSYLSNPSQLRQGLHHGASFGRLCRLWWWDSGSQSKREKDIQGILSGLDQQLSCTIDVHLYFTSQNLMLPKIGKEIFQILIRSNPALM